MSEWQPIDTAPRDGTVIDVWLNHETLADIEFYCQMPPTRSGGKGCFGGRSTGWMWLNGKFRPYLRGLQATVFVQPTHWMPLPEPPHS